MAGPSAPDLGVAPNHLDSVRLGSSGDPAFFRAAIQAGLLGIMANLIPFGLGMVLTGILAALLYHRTQSGALRTIKAVRLGALAGAISFVATVLLTVLAIVLLHSQQQFHDLMMKAIEQSVANQSGPEVQSFLQWVHTQQGFGIILILGMLGALVLSMLFAAVGGAIGSSLFRARNPPPL
jgi:hypothetical protein